MSYLFRMIEETEKKTIIQYLIYMFLIFQPLNIFNIKFISSQDSEIYYTIFTFKLIFKKVNSKIHHL